MSKISSLYLVSVAEQTGSSLNWSQTPKTGFLMTRLKYTWMEPEIIHGGCRNSGWRPGHKHLPINDV